LEKIPVIIVNWNGLDDTVECVDSVLKQSHQELIIYLVDNNSDNNEYEKLTLKFGNEPRIVLQKNETNIGFTLAHNQLFDRLLNSGANYVALLNNDAVAEKNWLRNILETAQSEKTDMVASIMLNYYTRSTVDSAGLFMLSSGEILPFGHGLQIEKLPHHKTTSVAACGGACLYRISLLKEIGTFDPYFSTGYEDAELGLRAYLAGKKISVAANSIVYHKMSRSVSKVFDRKKAQKIQEDINYTYLKLMPAGAILFNAISNIPRIIILLLIHLLTLRFRFVVIQTSAFSKTISELPTIFSRRKEFRKMRKSGSFKILNAQTFFLIYDLKRFIRIILKRERNQFEKY